MKNADLHMSLTRQIQESIAAEAGDGIKPEHVLLTIKPGSIIAETFIVPPAGVEAGAVVKELGKNSFLLEEMVVEISMLPGMQDIQTGPITASMSQAPKAVGAQTQAPESKTESSNMLLIIAISSVAAGLLGCCVLMCICRGGLSHKKGSLWEINSSPVVTGSDSNPVWEADPTNPACCV